MSYLPKKESELVDYLLDMNGLVSTNYAQYGVSQSDAETLSTVILDYTNLYSVCTNGQTRTPGKLAGKRAAKIACLEVVRRIVGQIQLFPGTTDEMRADLRITIRKTHQTPQPPPATAPGVTIGGVSGTTITALIDDPTSEAKRRRLPGTIGAYVFYYVGSQYPTDPGLWEFCGLATRYEHKCELPTSLAAGTQVWITAAWINRKGESSPLAQPVAAYVGYAGSSSAQQIKLAA